MHSTILGIENNRYVVINHNVRSHLCEATDQSVPYNDQAMVVNKRQFQTHTLGGPQMNEPRQVLEIR